MFKVESLPENTLIETEKQGAYMKGENGLWYVIDAHCVDCQDCISEAGTDKPTHYAPGITIGEKAQDYFGEFTILAVPIGFVPEEEV